MPVGNLRYGFLEQKWDSPISLGVQALIEYNGLVLNDRYQADRIRITGITGLDSADIRDSRQPRPAQHGENVYDAFYGGRNIVLTGAIEAGSLQVLNELKRDLLAAFAPLVETPLKFRWFDIYDNFDDPQTILSYSTIPSHVTGNYEALIGSNNDFSVENGYLTWNAKEEIINYILNPSFAHDENLGPPKTWTTGSSYLIDAGATAKSRIVPGYAQTASIFGLDSYCVIETAGKTSQEGLNTEEYIQCTKGNPITIYVSLYEEVGGQEVKLKLGSAICGVAENIISQKTSGWARHSVTLIPKATGVARFGICTGVTKKVNIIFAAVSSSEPYKDGDTSECEWGGEAGDSVTISQSKNNYLIRAAEKRVYGDVQSTIRITPGSINTNSTFGFIFGIKNSENFCRCIYNQKADEPFIAVQTVVGGVTYELERATIPASLRPSLGIPFYFRGRKEGNTLISEFWQNSPSKYNLPTVSTSAEMEGTDASTFGDTVLAQVGFGGEQKDNLWKFDEYRIESLYPGDIAFNARCIAAPQIKDEQSNLQKFKRSLQITLRSSDFRAFGTAQIRKSITPTESEGPLLGRGYKRFYLRGYKSFISSTVLPENNILHINNRGSVSVEPILVMYGPFKNLYLKNLVNEQELSYEGTIQENDFLVIECGKKKSVTNSVGINKAESFKSNSSAWIVLEPMWNDIYIVGKGFNETTTKLVVYMEPGYLG